MDRRDAPIGTGSNGAKTGSGVGPYVIEEGKQYRMPYRMVRKVTFSNLKKAELLDLPHSARLQYRLMLLGAVIKAAVDFDDAQITIIYNPSNADNSSDKTSQGELVKMLSKEGVHVDPSSARDVDYDYYTELYANSHNPKTIKESPPYGYTADEWSAMRSKWQKKMTETATRKREKFTRWQASYLNSKLGIVQKIAEEHRSEVEKGSTTN